MILSLAGWVITEHLVKTGKLNVCYSKLRFNIVDVETSTLQYFLVFAMSWFYPV